MVAVVAAMIMVLSMGMVSVNAAEVQPRLPLCPSCGSIMHPRTTYGQWVMVVSRPCTHGKKGTDRVLERTVSIVTKCTNQNCALAYPPVITKEQKIECKGYN